MEERERQEMHRGEYCQVNFENVNVIRKSYRKVNFFLINSTRK